MKNIESNLSLVLMKTVIVEHSFIIEERKGKILKKIIFLSKRGFRNSLLNDKESKYSRVNMRQK